MMMLIQTAIDVVFCAGLFVLWTKLHRHPKDDPRLSRGLQLLQSKIAVLEDLSDRTDVQFKQLSSLLEQKGREVHDKVQAAEKQIQHIKISMQKSLEVAKIFQDKIPHEEIIERQNTVKYVRAAQLAHQGSSVEEIEKQIDLSRSEIELIAKLNKKQLMFSEAELPAWVEGASATHVGRSEVGSVSSKNMEVKPFEFRKIDRNGD